jgi:hypothetical protein
LRVATDRTGGYADVSAELDLVMQKALCAIRGDRYENKRCGLATSLEAEACAGKLDEGRSAPAVTGAACDNALAVLTAYEESGLFEAGDDGDAGRVHGNAVGDAAIGGCHQLMENFVRGFDALIELGFIGGVGGNGRRCKQDDSG